jgi:hypothetical protein
MSIKHVQLIYSNCEVESNKFENSFKNLPLIYNHLPDDLMFVSSDSELSNGKLIFLGRNIIYLLLMKNI